MKRPLTGQVLLYAGGIWAGSHVDWLVGGVMCGSLALVGAFFLYRHTRGSHLLLGLAFFSVGVLAIRDAQLVRGDEHVANWLIGGDQSVGLRGVIETDAAAQRGFRVRLTEVQRDQQWQRATGKIYVWLQAGSAVARPPLQYGDLLEFSTRLQAPTDIRNPGGFQLIRWLAQQRVYVTGTIGKHDRCVVRERGCGNWLTAVSLRLRERFQVAVHAGLEDEPKLGGVLAGLVIGERAEIPPETYRAFQRTGVFHVFSTSGLNVMLVTGVFLTALRLMQMPRRWCAFIAMPALILYVFATGGRPGAVRSLVMAGVLLVGWALVRPIDIMNSLAAAALVILVWDPLQLFDGGFVLSFLVVAALVTLTPPIEQQITGWFATDPLLPDTLRPEWRQALDKPLRKFVRLVSGSIAAWVGLLPLMAVYFNLFSPMSIAANIIAVPALGVITALGLIAMFAHPFWEWLTITLNNANFLLLAIMIRAVEWLGSIDQGYLFVQSPPLWLTLAYYLVLGLLMATFLAWHKRVALAAAVGGVALAGVWFTWPDAVVEISVLELSRGRAAFINLPGERDDFLIDAADDWGGGRVLQPFLRSQGVDRLFRAILTSGTRGDAGGLLGLVAEVPTAEFAYTSLASRSKYLKAWSQPVGLDKIPIRVLRASADWEAQGPLRLRILHPAADWRATRSRHNALVVQLATATTRVLFLADGGERVEQELLARWPADELRAAIIINGNPGNEPSCSDAFLDAVRPEAVVLAAQQDFGRRSQTELGARLANRGVRFYRTDESGAARIRLDAQGYSIRPWL